MPKRIRANRPKTRRLNKPDKGHLEWCVAELGGNTWRLTFYATSEGAETHARHSDPQEWDEAYVMKVEKQS